MDILFFFNSLALGVALAMDAFSVSIANGLAEPYMRRGKHCLISACFAFFQFIMPMIGWFILHKLVDVFTALKGYIPWIALILLVIIGSKMIFEAFGNNAEDVSKSNNGNIGLAVVLVQGIATSIDALSVGFTIVDYDAMAAVVCSIIIAAVTFAICYTGLLIGKTVGNRLSFDAGLIGGIILIAIGIEIFVKGTLF